MNTQKHYNTLTVTENVLKIVENWFKAEKLGDKNARSRAAYGLSEFLIETDDGSYTLRSNDFNGKSETMHTYHGAITESIEKYVRPSKLKEKMAEGKDLHVLDICSGLGYHSAACIEFLNDSLNDKNLNDDNKSEHPLIKDHPKIYPKIRIDMVEISIETIAANLLIPSPVKSHEIIKKAVENKLYDEGFLKFKFQDEFQLQDEFKKSDVLNKNILENLKINENSGIINENHEIKGVQDKTCKDKICKKPEIKENWDKPCKTYETKEKLDKISKNLDINIYCEDARNLIKKIVKTHDKSKNQVNEHDYGENCGNYDAIFLAPFSPSKSPELCTVEFFKALKTIIKEDGMILTYTSAAPVRFALIEAGFHLGEGPRFGRTGGTIASPSLQNIDIPLTMKDERMIALSDAGVPFRDHELNSSGFEIAEKRANKRKIVRGSSKFASSVKTPLYLGREDIDDPRLKRRVLKNIAKLGFKELNCEKLKYIICPQFDSCICGSNCQKIENSRDRVKEMVKRLSELVE
jgi:tRNA U34 5-methylaminomethyl-2-thiouridine-forming methyltransferase MnmC